MVNYIPAERPLAARVNALGSQVTLDIPDALTNAITLVPGRAREDARSEAGLPPTDHK
jgi:hypothetical protein